MTSPQVVKTYIKSYDLWVAVIITTLLALSLPSEIRASFAKDLYGIGISVLSIVFSVSFAGMAVIMSATHDEFIVYLQEKQRFTQILNTFKFTLTILFLALVVAITAYAITAYRTVTGLEMQSRIWILIFSFLFIYSLAAALLASLDSVKFSTYRCLYLTRAKESQQRA
jgi:hypothetical protein